MLEVFFFNKYTKLVEEMGLQSWQIHNVDELAIDMNLTGKIIAIKGMPYYQEVKGKMDHVTLVSCIMANGKCMKHLLILKGQSIPANLRLDELLLLTVSKNRWMYSNTKSAWFNYFLEYIGNNRPKEQCKPHLLLIDRHSSNWNISLIENAKQHNVTILMFPPHTMHLIQPLDNLFFWKLKKEIRRARGTDYWRHHCI